MLEHTAHMRAISVGGLHILFFYPICYDKNELILLYKSGGIFND